MGSLTTLDHLSLQCSPPNMRRYSHGVHNNVHDSTALVACDAESLLLERLAKHGKAVREWGGIKSWVGLKNKQGWNTGSIWDDPPPNNSHHRIIYIYILYKYV